MCRPWTRYSRAFPRPDRTNRTESNDWVSVPEQSGTAFEIPTAPTRPEPAGPVVRCGLLEQRCGNLIANFSAHDRASRDHAASVTVASPIWRWEMLSQNERRRLDAIERQLESEDPDLAHRLASRPRSPYGRWVTFLAVTAVILATLGVLLGFLLLSPAVFVPSGLLLLGAWIWLSRRASG
jgi:hypothetical protein